MTTAANGYQTNGSGMPLLTFRGLHAMRNALGCAKNIAREHRAECHTCSTRTVPCEIGQDFSDAVSDLRAAVVSLVDDICEKGGVCQKTT